MSDYDDGDFNDLVDSDLDDKLSVFVPLCPWCGEPMASLHDEWFEVDGPALLHRRLRDETEPRSMSCETCGRPVFVKERPAVLFVVNKNETIQEDKPTGGATLELIIGGLDE